MEQEIYSMLYDYVEKIMVDLRNVYSVETDDEVAEEDAYELLNKERELAVIIGGILRKEMGRR